MTKHLLCLTVDTDPDGLSGRVTNRQTLAWEGLEQLQNFADKLADIAQLGHVPITWFVRADGQLQSILGSASYLLETYDAFWTRVKKSSTGSALWTGGSPSQSVRRMFPNPAVSP